MSRQAGRLEMLTCVRALFLLVPVVTGRVHLLSQPCCGYLARSRPLRAQCGETTSKTLDDFADVLGGQTCLARFKGYLRAAASSKLLTEWRDSLLEVQTASPDKVRLSFDPFIAYYTQAQITVHEEFAENWVQAEFEVPGFAEVRAVISERCSALSLAHLRTLRDLNCRRLTLSVSLNRSVYSLALTSTCRTSIRPAWQPLRSAPLQQVDIRMVEQRVAKRLRSSQHATQV